MRLSIVWAVTAALAFSGCGEDTPAEQPPAAYCSTAPDAEDAEFWALIEASCREASDGDLAQARALRKALSDLGTREVAAFHKTFVRINRSLYTEDVAEAADNACPGLGQGDLFTDLRSWIVAHGQEAYEAVLNDPSVLAEFPDLPDGCGLGEPYGYAALDVYAKKTSSEDAFADLPPLEPTGPPDETAAQHSYR